MQTSEISEHGPNFLSDSCVACLCEQSPKTIGLCNDQAEACWGLIGCARANCADKQGMDESDCAVAFCAKHIGGAALAMTIGVLIRGETCAAKCALTSDAAATNRAQ